MAITADNANRLSIPSLHKSEEEKRKGPVYFPSFHKEGWPEGPGWFGFSPAERMYAILSVTGSW
jgi:hypothetical protein